MTTEHPPNRLIGRSVRRVEDPVLITAKGAPALRHAADLSGQTMLDIRLRPIVKAPEGLDITPAVMEELGLTVE